MAHVASSLTFLPAISHVFEQRSHPVAVRVTVGETRKRKSQPALGFNSPRPGHLASFPFPEQDKLYETIILRPPPHHALRRSQP